MKLTYSFFRQINKYPFLEMKDYLSAYTAEVLRGIMFDSLVESYGLESQKVIFIKITE